MINSYENQPPHQEEKGGSREKVNKAIKIDLTMDTEQVASKLRDTLYESNGRVELSFDGGEDEHAAVDVVLLNLSAGLGQVAFRFTSRGYTGDWQIGTESQAVAIAFEEMKKAS